MCIHSDQLKWCVCVFVCCSHLCVPDVYAFVKRAAGQVSAVGAEGHAVDRLLVFGQRVNADSSLHVPETHRGVEGGAEGRTDRPTRGGEETEA